MKAVIGLKSCYKSTRREWAIYNMMDLYNYLVDKDLIYTGLYDPYTKASFEKAGYDYTEIDSKYTELYNSEDLEWCDFLKLYELPDLTEKEIYSLIKSEISSSYIVNVYYYGSLKDIEFDENGNIIPYIEVKE